MILESLSSMFGGKKEEPAASKEEKLADLRSRREALLAWRDSPDKHYNDSADLEKLENEIVKLESEMD